LAGLKKAFLMQLKWWKILGVLLVLYSIIAGLLLPVPQLDILNESIRNLYFHVTMWFSMIILMLMSMIQSIRFLNGFDKMRDLKAEALASTGMFIAVLGLTTGMIWAQFTWGAFWVNDPKLNGAAVTMLIYLAYFILRNSIENEDSRARVSAIYNILAFVMMIVFIGVLPRMTDSLHPGNGGNPGFGNYDLDSNMRMVFYPAVIGWILVSTWIAQLRYRIKVLEIKKENL
jgi:heme exporter protein C